MQMPDLSKPLTGTMVVDWKATNGTISYSGIKKGVKPIMKEYTPNKARTPFNIVTEEVLGD
jgi:hypothetical protein